MKKRLSYCTLTILPGVVAILVSLWLKAASPAQADPTTRYVAPTGSDAGPNDCTNGGTPCETIQHAIDQADPGDEIRMAGGTYANAGTVAAITKSLTIIGAYDPAFNGPDPDMYESVLDAQWGGPVISMTNAGDVLLQHLTLTGGDGAGSCGTVGCGGGVYAKDTILHVGHCVITNNVGSRAGQGRGGGVYIDNVSSSASADIWESHIVSNTASTADTGWGGGIWLQAGTSTAPGVVVSSTIEDNTASAASYGEGGGMYVLQYAKLSNNLFQHNVAQTAASGFGYGGGLYLWEIWGATLEANRFVSNTASALGGGYGGAIFGSAKVVLTMTNNLLAQNHASTAGGGLLLTTSPPYLIPGTLVHNTIADNDAGAGGEGIWVGSYVSLTLANNIVAGHTVGITNTVPASSTVAADYTLFADNGTDYGSGVSSTNEVSGDPAFVAPDEADYHLAPGSAAIDAGDEAGVPIDFEGDARPLGPAPDIGADEAWLRSFVPLLMKLY
ncbi:MAG: hypothetical protein GTO63_00750 [Anaerolineae bacterium]|nr:hypothetical protein [Anaerolineae bacterium]NIN93538.1 hypothetical protein [Anaerolineae bacterium]NIQ76607.1 hypothetical protein [Anaerolineae bacterium]